jgi:hypothetical protein
MTTWYSDQMTNILATPSVKLPVSDMSGKLRVAKVSWIKSAVAGEAADVIEICKLPAGRVRFLGHMSELYHNMTTGSNTIDIGWKAYTDLDGDAVVADPDGLDDGISVETAGWIGLGTVAAVLALGQEKTFESQEGVILTVTSVGIIAASDRLHGSIVYATD